MIKADPSGGIFKHDFRMGSEMSLIERHSVSVEANASEGWPQVFVCAKGPPALTETQDCAGENDPNSGPGRRHKYFCSQIISAVQSLRFSRRMDRLSLNSMVAKFIWPFVTVCRGKDVLSGVKLESARRPSQCSRVMPLSPRHRIGHIVGGGNGERATGGLTVYVEEMAPPRFEV